jgi:hypothetical protein
MKRVSFVLVLVAGLLWGAAPTVARSPWPPEVRISNTNGSQRGGSYTATWTYPAGKNACVMVHGDGIPTWSDSLSHPIGEPAEITFVHPVKPQRVSVLAYRGVDPVGPIGDAEELPYELSSRTDEGERVWVATIEPTVIADLYLDVSVAWRVRGRCGGPHDASYTLHLSNP